MQWCFLRVNSIDHIDRYIEGVRRSRHECVNTIDIIVSRDTVHEVRIPLTVWVVCVGC